MIEKIKLLLYHNPNITKPWVFGKESMKLDGKLIKKIIVGIHGIRTHEESWIDSFIRFCTVFYKDNDILYVDYAYNFLPAILSINPLIKWYLTSKFKKKLHQLQRDYPNASINIIAHSYGTELTYLSLKTKDDVNGFINVDKVILLASILNIKTDLSKIYANGQFKEFHVFSSLEDEVCRWNPFGHSGFIGLKDDFATNHRPANLEHGDYFTIDFFKKYAKIFDLKKKEL